MLETQILQTRRASLRVSYNETSQRFFEKGLVGMVRLVDGGASRPLSAIHLVQSKISVADLARRRGLCYPWDTSVDEELNECEIMTYTYAKAPCLLLI
jgi:hypothetical protein